MYNFNKFTETRVKTCPRLEGCKTASEIESQDVSRDQGSRVFRTMSLVYRA